MLRLQVRCGPWRNCLIPGLGNFLLWIPTPNKPCFVSQPVIFAVFFHVVVHRPLFSHMNRNRHGKYVFFIHADLIARTNYSKRRGKLLVISGEVCDMLTTAIRWTKPYLPSKTAPTGGAFSLKHRCIVSKNTFAFCSTPAIGASFADILVRSRMLFSSIFLTLLRPVMQRCVWRRTEEALKNLPGEVRRRSV